MTIAPAMLLMSFVLLGGVAACLIPRFKRKAPANRSQRRPAKRPAHLQRVYDWQIDGECRPPYPRWRVVDDAD